MPLPRPAAPSRCRSGQLRSLHGVFRSMSRQRTHSPRRARVENLVMKATAESRNKGCRSSFPGSGQVGKLPVALRTDTAYETLPRIPRSSRPARVGCLGGGRGNSAVSIRLQQGGWTGAGGRVEKGWVWNGQWGEGRPGEDLQAEIAKARLGRMSNGAGLIHIG